MDGLEKALLAGVEQQLTQGQMDPVLVAKIATKLTDPEMSLADAITAAHEEAQKEQAAQQQSQQQAAQQPGGGAPQGMADPSQMAGINQTPPATPSDQKPEGQPSIAPPPQGAMDLKSLLGALGGGASAA